MALTSGDFMVATGLASSNLDRVDCSDVLAAVLLKDTATLGQIPMKGTAKNVEHKWIEDSLNLNTFLAEMSDSTTLVIQDSNASTTAKVARIMRYGALIMPEGAEFVAQIASLGSTLSITVSVHGTTSFSSIATTTRFFVVGQPYTDTSDASDDISQSRTVRSNYTQIFERAIAIAETRKHIDLYAVDDELKLQIKYRTMEVKRELNTAVLMGYAIASSSSFTSTDERRTMAGIIQQLRDPDFDQTNEDTTVTNASDAALTLTKINDLCKKMFDEGGFPDDSNCCIIVGPYQARVIALLEEARIRKSSKELIVGSYANKVMTDLGFELPVVLDRWLPNDKLIVLDKAAVSLMPLQGDAWHLEKMAKSGRTEKYQLSGQYTLELRNAESRHGMLYGLAYS